MEGLGTLYANHPNLVVSIAGGIVVATAGIIVYKWMRTSSVSTSEGDYPSNTVILYQLGRGPYAPSLVPFAIKLETYLRMAKIPYKNNFSGKRSSKGKWPSISYNGQIVADSAFCIEFLNKQRDLDLNSWLSSEQRAVALAFQRLVEENLYWVMVVQRWVQEVSPEFVKALFPVPMSMLFFKFFLQRDIRKMSHSQGVGRHSKEEVLHIGKRDLTALSDFLGSKKYLMGDQPCEQDCAIFGQLSQLYWHLPGPCGVIFKEEFPRLVAYCERIKETFWPDWLECTTQGGTTKATK